MSVNALCVWKTVTLSNECRRKKVGTRVGRRAGRPVSLDSLRVRRSGGLVCFLWCVIAGEIPSWSIIKIVTNNRREGGRGRDRRCSRANEKFRKFLFLFA